MFQSNDFVLLASVNDFKAIHSYVSRRLERLEKKSPRKI